MKTDNDSNYYEKIIKEQIRTLAYILAEKDSFKQKPEYYWIEAEIKILYDYKWKTKMKQVDLKELFAAFEFLKEINKEDILNIQWTLNGQPVQVSMQSLEEWKFIGLNNSEFPKYAFDKDTEVGKLFNQYNS